MSTPLTAVVVTLRILTSTAVFAAGCLPGGPPAVLIGGGVGLVLGALHAWALVTTDSYPGGAKGWLLVLLDHTWSLLNTVAGSLFLTLNLMTGNTVNRSMSAGRSSVVMQRGVFPGFATTIGTVEAGTGPGIARHEYVHVLQARIFGPFYLPLVGLNYVVATVLPYWLLYHDRAGHPIHSVGDYFLRGVYPHSWNEEWAYAVEGSPP